MAYAAPLIGDGLNDWLRSWMGGFWTQDITTTMQDLARHITLENKNHTSISNGVENRLKLTPKINLITTAKVLWGRIKDNGFDF